MPASASSKKANAEATPAKESSTSSEVTPLRISSRVRKEKFSVKELFSNSNKDIVGDEEPKRTPKKKVVAPPAAKVQTESKVQSGKSETSSKPSTSKQVSTAKSQVQESSTPKPSTSKAQTPAKVTTRKNSDSAPPPSTSKETSPKVKARTTSTEEKLDPSVADNVKVDPIFNEDNIDTVLENPGSLGLDVVVTRLRESDQKENDHKKSKNVVTIAKMTGSATASKPIKVVPMKPTEKILESSEDNKMSKALGFKGSGVVITHKVDKNDRSTSTSLVDKKRIQHQRRNLDGSLKESNSLGTDVVVVTQTIDTKGTISSRIVEKKFDSKLEQKTKGKVFEAQRQKAVKRSILDVMSDVRTNGHKSKVKTVEADSSSQGTTKKARTDSSQTESDDFYQRPIHDFDRYFTTSESNIEHNESLDSEDSGDENNETYLSHFYEKEAQKPRSSDEEYTIYDLMYEVSFEHPSWNLHVMQDAESFLICQVTRGPHGLPTMSKMIELESDLSSAKVYVNQIFHREFCGSYNTYESIRELIANVQQL